MSRFCRVAVTLAVTAVASTSPVWLTAQQQPPSATIPPPAQPPAPAQATEPPARPASTRNVQVDVTVTLQGGGGTPVSKKMTLVAGDRQLALGRSGIEVAVQLGAAQSTPSAAFSYRTVGLNVDARPQIQPDNRISLNVKLNFSAILKREGGEPGPPSFGNSSTELNLVLDSGRAIVIAQAADAEIGRAYSVEVKATILK
jgi:Bacterial type II and III secretion system protein